MKPIMSKEKIRALEAEYMRSNAVSVECLILLAAERLAQIVRQKTQEIGRLQSKNVGILIVAGKGNNGNDGRALHKILSLEGYRSTLFELTEDVSIAHNAFNDYDIIVDAIFGIGLNQEPKGVYLDAINAINNASAFKLAVDIPSGLDANTGETLSQAVRADMTLTFIALKSGMLFLDALDACGEIVVGDIGIVPKDEDALVFEDSDFVLRRRKRNSHKGDYGKLKIIAGSMTMPGAAVLAHSASTRTIELGGLNLAKAASKSGAGLVCLAVPSSLKEPFLARTVESTLFFLPDVNGLITFDQASINTLLANTDAFVFGCGLGRNPELIKYIDYLLKQDITLVLDADGLNALAEAGTERHLAEKRARVLLTPHMVEFSRLTGLTVEVIQKDPIKIAREFAKKHNVFLLLKGASTIITDGERTIMNTKGSPALAKGGSGDVLSGIVGALACRFDPLTALSYSAYILGCASIRGEKEYGESSLIASELVNMIRF